MNIKIILLSLAFAALASCKAEPVINRVPGGDDKEEPALPPGSVENTLTVCSFNIRYYNTTDPYPWSVRKDAVMKFLKEVRPDFAGIQELRSTQAQDFSYNLGSEYGFYEINRDTGNPVSSSGSGEAVGILYRKDRFSVEDKGFFWLSEEPDKLPEENDDGTFSSWNSACRRVVLWVKAKDRLNSDRTVYFFATHFDHKSSTARLKSSELTLKKMKEIIGVSDLLKSSAPAFLVADFNCKSGTSELAPLETELNYSRTAAKKSEKDYRTFNNFGETADSIIDHIFYIGNVTADEYDVVTEDYGVEYISDHYPILFKCTYK